MVRLTVAILLFASSLLLAAPDPQEAAVLAVVQRLFDGMAARDAAVLRAVMLPDGRYFSVRADNKIGGGTNSEFIERIAASKENLLERMWNPRVMIHGSIASVWAPYDFHRNRKFNHCGVDSFQLLKTTEGWKIATITYTVETTGCQPSPLGPPAQLFIPNTRSAFSQ